MGLIGVFVITLDGVVVVDEAMLFLIGSTFLIVEVDGFVIFDGVFVVDFGVMSGFFTSFECVVRCEDLTVCGAFSMIGALLSNCSLVTIVDRFSLDWMPIVVEASLFLVA